MFKRLMQYPHRSVLLPIPSHHYIFFNLCKAAILVPRIPLDHQLLPRNVINPVRNRQAHDDEDAQVVGIDLEGLFGDFASAVPFLDVLVLSDVHFVGEGSFAHFPPAFVRVACDVMMCGDGEAGDVNYLHSGNEK